MPLSDYGPQYPDNPHTLPSGCPPDHGCQIAGAAGTGDGVRFDRPLQPVAPLGARLSGAVADVAQLAAHPTCNRAVAGSSPAVGSIPGGQSPDAFRSALGSGPYSSEPAE